MASKNIKNPTNFIYISDATQLVIDGFDNDNFDSPLCDPTSNSVAPNSGLKPSIKRSGQLQAVRVWKRKCSVDHKHAFVDSKGTTQPFMFVVNFGRGRVRSIREINEESGAPLGSIERVAVKFEITANHSSDLSLAQAMLGENSARRNINSMDEAKEIARLVETCGLPMKELAEALGMTAASVKNKLSLNTLAPEVQEAVTTGEIGAASGYEIAKLEDKDDQKLALEVATDNGKEKTTTEEVTKVVTDVKKANAEVAKVTPNDVASTRAPITKAPKTLKPKKAGIIEMRDALLGSFPEAAAALNWVLGVGGDAEFSAALKGETETVTLEPASRASA